MIKDKPISPKQGAYYMMSKPELLTDKAKARYPQPPFHTRFLEHYNNPFEGRELMRDEDEEGMTVDEVVKFFGGNKK